MARLARRLTRAGVFSDADVAALYDLLNRWAPERSPADRFCTELVMAADSVLDVGGRRGMVTGMASRKVTITLDETQLERVRALVAAGTAASVSGFVQHAVSVALDDVAGWGETLAEALRESGGAVSDSERAWADQVLGITGRRDSPAS